MLFGVALCLANISSFGQSVFLYDGSGNRVFSGVVSDSPPVILNQPQNRLVIPNHNTSFSVIVSNAVGAGYQWKLNGTNIAGATADTLLITNATVANVGDYQVVISNSVDQVTSAVVRLDLDSNRNGLPDSWELAYFGSLTNQTPLGDYDGDGVSNYDEWRDGTNPTNNASLNPRLIVNAFQGAVSVSPDLPEY